MINTEKLYTVDEIATELKISSDSVYYRIKKLGIVPYSFKINEKAIFKKPIRIYSFYQFEIIKDYHNEINGITNNRVIKNSIINDDYEILPSRLNNTEIENL